MKKTIKIIIGVIIGLHIILFGLLFFFQEKLFFHPQKLGKDYVFTFNQHFEEINIESEDGIMLNGILFKSDSTKGLIFYLHGNVGSLSSWGEIAKTYTDLNYDVFILDYRGFGKSEGRIMNQKQLFTDNQTAYDEMKKRYHESNIIIMGYSIGTGMASKLASTNNPKLLILEAPYYSFKDLISHSYPFFPKFLLKYKLLTNEYLKSCNVPVVIFHGNQDEVIYYGSSVKLEKEFKEGDKLITLDKQGHNGITFNKNYIIEMENILK